MGEIQDKRTNLTYPATQILDKDLVELKNLSASRRRELYNNLQENKEEYEWDFYPANREVIPEATKEKELAAFEAAKLLLATAVEDAEEQTDDEIVSQFETEEREFVRQFDNFRRKFKQIDESNLETNIKNKDGEVYEFVTEEIKSQADLRASLLDTGENEIRGATISYFQREFETFFDLANRAVFLYIKHHGLPNTIESVVDAAEVTADASAERERIETTVQRQLEQLSESLHEDIREKEQSLLAGMSRLENELATGGQDDDQIQHELAEINNRLEDLSERREADARELSERLETVQSLENDLQAKIEELESARERAMEELQEEESEARMLLEDELERLHQQKSDIASEVERLRAERERLETAGDRIDREYDTLKTRVTTAEDRIDEEVDELESQLDTITESLRTGTDEHDGKAIRAEIARLYEMDYISRFEQSMQETKRLTLPDNEMFDVPDGFWDDRRRHFSGDHCSTVVDALDDEDARVDRYPVGRYSVYRVLANKFIAFSETKLVIEAVVKSNLEAFAANGFDARPAGIDDLLDVVNEVRTRSESNETAHLIGIASPTGWTDEVKSLVRDEESARTTYGKQISVCLVDIQSNDLVYDSTDPLVAENVSLFEREVDTERVAACVETIREKYADDPMTSVVQHHEIIDAHGYDPHIVQQAFDRLADQGVGRTGYPSAAEGFCLLLD